MKRENEDIVLDYLNSLRETFELGPPLKELSRDAYRDERKAHGVSATCPVAQALGMACGTGEVEIKGQRVVFPSFVTDFQNAHDDPNRGGRPAGDASQLMPVQ